MTVQVEAFDGLHKANNPLELEDLLMRRHNGANHFWLSHESKKHPSLALAVRGNLAGLHYFPRESHPGFAPDGNMAGLTDGESTIFYMDIGGEEVEIINNAIVPFSTALTVAKEFFSSESLPKSIQWTEL